MSPFRFVQYCNFMKISRAIVFITLAVLLQGISLSVSSMKERCMIVSSNNQEQFLKADLRFARFSDQTIEQGYRIVLHNTETHEQQAYQISEGTFRKQFELTEHVVYRFCFKIVLIRYREVRAIMEYNADVKHIQYNLDGQITVPAGLLKVEDLKITYTNVVNLERLLKIVKERAPEIKKQEDIIFEDQNQQMKTLTLISFVEIVVVISFGIYQYFRLKTLIERKY